MTHLVTLGLVLAQLDPTVGAPLAGGAVAAPSGTVLVKLPESFGMRQRVVAHHGTEIYALPEWKAVCPARGAKPQVAFVDGVLGVERTGLSYDVRSVSDDQEFPLACRLYPMRGRFTLIMADPGHPRSPALAARTPDFVVP